MLGTALEPLELIAQRKMLVNMRENTDHLYVQSEASSVPLQRRTVQDVIPAYSLFILQDCNFFFGINKVSVSLIQLNQLHLNSIQFNSYKKLILKSWLDSQQDLAQTIQKCQS